MIKFENVGLRYGIGPEVLSDVSFTLENGSFHFLSGASGAGKSSLLSLLYLGRKPTRGLINIFGQDVGQMNREDRARIRQKIGVVFQDFRLFDHMNVFDNIALPLRVMGQSEKHIRHNVGELIEWVGLGEYQNRLPNTLSGGQQQRIAIARAVITKPKLILADEPTGNLDDEIGLRLMNLFDQLNRMGTTVLIASHNTLLMEKFSNHGRLLLDNGTLKSFTPKETIKKKLGGVF